MSATLTIRRLVVVFATSAVLVVATLPTTRAAVSFTPTTFLGAGELFDDPVAGLDHIVLVYSGPLDPTSVPGPADFLITTIHAQPLPPAPSPGWSSTEAPASVSIPHVAVPYVWPWGPPQGVGLSVVRLGLHTHLLPGDVATVTYTPGVHPLLTAPTIEIFGFPVPGFVNEPIQTGGPLAFDAIKGLAEEAVGPNHVVVLFTRPLSLTDPLPDRGDFAVTVERPVADPPSVTTFVMTPSGVGSLFPGYGMGVLDLVLPQDLAPGDIVNVSYVPGTTSGSPPLLDGHGTPAPAFPNLTVDLSLAPYPLRSTPVSTVPITVSPPDPSTGARPVAVTFSSVTSGGTTTVTASPTGPPVPAGFQLGTSPVFYEIATTAVYTPPVTVCVVYDDSAFVPPDPPRLLHFEGSSWIDVTTSLDTATHTLCGVVNSLSPFTVAGLHYPFSGFFSPVDNQPVVNISKAGSAIPIKFALGGDRGLGIFATGYPRSQVVACNSSAPLDGIEETVGPGAATLSFSPDSGRYQYVWKTQKAWAGSCRQFVMMLVDGTAHRATFKFQ